jgi:all-trans-retinol 13,14-reductase
MAPLKVVVIGSGMSGLTLAAYCARAGHHVTVCEQYPGIGGVTATMRHGGFGWDLGPLLLEGFGPADQGTRILDELGARGRIRAVREDRGIVFPDFSLWKPCTYGGPLWRRERLAEIFPDEREGLARYYRFHERMMDLASYLNEAEESSMLRSILPRMKAFRAFQSLRKYKNLSSRQLMESLFTSPRLRAVFTAILADIVTRPSQFPAMGVPLFNQEAAFDKRIPLETGAGRRAGYYYLLGGCGTLVEAVADVIRSHGGRILTKAPVRRIGIKDGKATGVLLSDGSFIPADIVAASGGARETFLHLVGREHLPRDFPRAVVGLHYMESVFMVQLGINFDPSPHQPAALCYYYGTYNIEGGVDRVIRGEYHEGKDGFLVYVPSMHTPELAPPGSHAVTIYTIAPNHLPHGSWEEHREALTRKMLSEAEKHIPGLSGGIEVKITLTPGDFRLRTHQHRHAFGGIAPVMGQKNPSHRTPIEGLWFIGSQSESGGGVLGVMKGARKVAAMIDPRVKRSMGR